MPLDLQLFLISVFFIFFQGVPRILKRQGLPLQLNFVQVSDASFTERQKRHFGELDEKMAKLGFTPVLNYAVTNLSGPNISRCYLSSLDAARVNAVLLIGSRTQVNPIQALYLEISTNFKDGTSLTTMNSETATFFDLLPGRVRQKFPAVKDPEELKNLHDLKLGEFKDRERLYISKEDIFPRHEKYHAEFCEYQMKRGLLRLLPGETRYRLTLKATLRAVMNYLNPFAPGLVWKNLFWAILGGVLIPVSGVYFSPVIIPFLQQAMGLEPVTLSWILDLVLYAFGGAVVGYVLARRVFVWGFLLAYLPSRILTLAGLLAFEPRFIPLSLLLTSVAQEVSVWKRKRERII